jgi:hypothetical protein
MHAGTSFFGLLTSVLIGYAFISSGGQEFAIVADG